MTTSFLFLAERQTDTKAPPDAQVTSLTGILVPSEAHGSLRTRVLRLISETVDGLDDPVSGLGRVVPGNLLPEQDDPARAAFLEGLVSLVNASGAAVYRIGYRKTYGTISQLEYLCGSADLVTGQNLVGLCLSSIVRCMRKELGTSRIWPVVERTEGPGWSAITMPVETPFDDPNLGDVLYGSKRSAHGTTAECVAYLLHLGWLRSMGVRQMPFAEELAGIAAGLDPLIAVNEVIDLKVQQPPPGYAAEGPIPLRVPDGGPRGGHRTGHEPALSGTGARAAAQTGGYGSAAR